MLPEVFPAAILIASFFSGPDVFSAGRGATLTGNWVAVASKRNTPVGFGGAAAQEADAVVLVVNGESFTRREFEDVIAELRLQTSGYGADTLTSGQLPPPLTIIEVVDRIVVAQRGRDLGFVLGDEQFESVVDNIRRRNSLNTEERWHEALVQQRVSLPTLRSNLERQLSYGRLHMYVLRNFRITEDEARRYYNLHRAEFGLASFEQSRDQIQRAVATAERQAQEWNSFTEALHRRATIEWRDEYLREQYENGRTQAPDTAK